MTQELEYIFAGIERRAGWIRHDLGKKLEFAQAILAKYQDTISKPDDAKSCQSSNGNLAHVEDALYASLTAEVVHPGYEEPVTVATIAKRKEALQGENRELARRKRELEEAATQRFAKLRSAAGSFRRSFSKEKSVPETPESIAGQIRANNQEWNALDAACAEIGEKFNKEKGALRRQREEDYACLSHAAPEISKAERELAVLSRFGELVKTHADDLDHIPIDAFHDSIDVIKDKCEKEVLEGDEPGLAGLAACNHKHYRLGRNETCQILGKGLEGLDVNLKRNFHSNHWSKKSKTLFSDIIFSITARDENKTGIGKVQLLWYPEKNELVVGEIEIYKGYESLGLGKIAVRNILTLGKAMGVDHVRLAAGEEDGPVFWAHCGAKLQEEDVRVDVDWMGRETNTHYGRETYNRYWQTLCQSAFYPEEARTAILAETQKDGAYLHSFIADLLKPHEKEPEYRELVRTFRHVKYAATFDLADAEQMQKVHEILHDDLKYKTHELALAFAENARSGARGVFP